MARVKKKLVGSLVYIFTMFNHIKSDQSIQSHIINRRLSRIVPKTYNKTLYFPSCFKQ